MSKWARLSMLLAGGALVCAAIMSRGAAAEALAGPHRSGPVKAEANADVAADEPERSPGDGATELLAAPPVVSRDPALAAQWGKDVARLVQDAEDGSAAAQFIRGLRYALGRGVAQDYAEAVRWYRKAAEQGQADAQFNLAVCYRQGTGVRKDDVEAVRWYRKAAEQGDAQAQFNLGVCYGEGTGVRKDYAGAVRWFVKAAERPQAERAGPGAEQPMAPVGPPVEAVAPPGRLSPYHWLLIGCGVVLLVVAAGAALARRKAAGG